MPWIATEKIEWNGEMLKPGDFVDGLEHHRHRDALVERGSVKAVPPENGECAFVAARPIKFKGQEYEPGDPIPNVRDFPRWQSLKDTGKITAAPPYTKDQEYDEEKRIKERAQRFYQGGGVYDIPGLDDVVRGQEEAVKVLKGKQ